ASDPRLRTSGGHTLRNPQGMSSGRRGVAPRRPTLPSPGRSFDCRTVRVIGVTTSTTTLGPAIRTLSRLARVLERGCADGDLSLPQYRLLAMVASGGQRSTALAERLAVAKP